MRATAPLQALLAAVAERQRIASRVVEGFSEWWEMPALLLGLAAAVAAVAWLYRRDAEELAPPLRALLAGLRLAALAAVVVAWLDFERTTEREIVLPSRVAVLVDASASMTLADEGVAATRAERALELLGQGELLAALRRTHEVSLWRFGADAERIAVLPRADALDGGAETAPDWADGIAPEAAETRLGEALDRVLAEEPAGLLAGVILCTDGGHNSGSDPLVTAASLAAARVAVHPLGIGSDILPANVRVADLLVPARVFPGDRFAVTAYLQPQGFSGAKVRVELAEAAAGATPQVGRVIDAVDVVLGADGALVPVRFDVPGLSTAGRRSLSVRVVPPAGDRAATDDVQSADVEVVDRVTRVLLMAGGPGREYQFMRNVLERDESFAVDVLLGTAAAGSSQDARRILQAFPESAEALDEYDAIVAIDADWRRLDPAARARLDRWVSRESGGLVLVAGSVFMDAWLSDPQLGPVRGLFPVELPQVSQPGREGGAMAPVTVEFSRDAADAEFLWLAGTRAGSDAVWAEWPGVYGCFPATVAKPGATVYARVGAATASRDAQPIFLAGQFYGSGTVLYVGSGELWRLRAVDDGAHDRLTAQLVRHVAQGRLLRGARRGRLLVDRERHPVGGAVVLQVVAAEGTATRPPTCRVTGPDGARITVPLAAEAGRSDVFRGSFIASREGGWQIDVDLPTAAGDEPLSRRIHAHLPDRELARPQLDRRLLQQLASTTGGSARFLHDAAWETADAERLAAAVPDRSRREYETGAADEAFKRRLNAALLTAAVGLLCAEWIIRRLVKLA